MKRFLKNMGFFFGLLMAAALCYVALVMLTGQFEETKVSPAPQGIDPLQPGQTADFAALQQAFGAPLPQLPGYAMQGKAVNETYQGKNVRMACLEYDGFVLTAVRPAYAAPLLLHEELSLSLEGDVSVAGLPAALAEGEGARCLYFSTEEAAYSLYAPNAGRESILALAERILLK